MPSMVLTKPNVTDGKPFRSFNPFRIPQGRTFGLADQILEEMGVLLVRSSRILVGERSESLRMPEILLPEPLHAPKNCHIRCFHATTRL